MGSNDRQLKTVINAEKSKVQKWKFSINRDPAINPKDLPQNLQFVVDTRIEQRGVLGGYRK